MDIVERLRTYTAPSTWDLIQEAADEIERLRGKYEEAISDIAEWGAYASEFFQNKHDLEGCIKGHLAALKETE